MPWMTDKAGSTLYFEREVDALKANICLPESEDSWERISQSIRNLRDLCEAAGSHGVTNFVPVLRSLHRPLLNAINSERTRLSGPAIDLITTVANIMGSSFEPLLTIFLPALINLCGKTNKVALSRAKACIMSIIETTQLPSILSHLLQYLKEKSASLRLIVAEGTLTCLNCCNPPDLEKESRAAEIESIIRASARDANAEVRKVSRKIFEAYRVLLPGRVESFSAPLTPTVRKYLNIKFTAAHPADHHGAPNVKLPTSSSLSKSASSVATTTTATHHPRQDGHFRSLSSSMLSLPSKSRDKQVMPSTQGAKKGNANVAVPDYAPTRPAQATRPLAVSDAKARTTAHAIRPTRPGNATKSLFNASRYTALTAAHSVDVREGPSRLPAQGITSIGASSGPQRVPLPQRKDQEIRPESRNRGIGSRANTVSEKIQTLASTTSTTLVKRIPENGDLKKSTSTKAQSKTAPSATSIANVSKRAAPQGGKAHSVTQRALPNIARQRKVTEPKPRSAIIAKPLWGRPTARRVSRSGLKKVARKSTGESAPTPASRTENIEIKDVKEQAPLPSNAPAQEGEVTSTSVNSPHSPSIGCGVGISPSSEFDANEADAESSVIDSADDQSPFGTPVGKQDCVSATKTPISALLSSIQMGFVLTPSSPLSPPERYQTREPLSGVTEKLNLPFQFPNTFYNEQKEIWSTEPEELHALNFDGALHLGGNRSEVRKE